MARKAAAAERPVPKNTRSPKSVRLIARRARLPAHDMPTLHISARHSAGELALLIKSCRLRRESPTACRQRWGIATTATDRQLAASPLEANSRFQWSLVTVALRVAVAGRDLIRHRLKRPTANAKFIPRALASSARDSVRL